MVADALSRKTKVNATTLITSQPQLVREMQQLDLFVSISPELATTHLTRNLTETTSNAPTMMLLLASIELQPDLGEKIKLAQQKDAKCRKFRAEAQEKGSEIFRVDDNEVLRFGDRICVPDDSEIKSLILAEAHESGYTIHPGEVKMYMDLKKQFWWPGMKREIAGFVSRCQICQQVKADRQKSAGFLQPLKRPSGKFESITMDFVTGFPRTKGRVDSIWVIVDRLTKVARFIPIRIDMGGKDLAELFLKNFYRLHGCPREIISDRDSRFTSHFWKSFQQAMGTKLSFSSAHHPQSDGQSERTIQSLEDMLRACALSFGGAWVDFLHLVEFAYNNSYHSSVGMSPNEALYGEACRTPLWWRSKGTYMPTGPEMLSENIEKVKMVQKRLEVARERQKRHANVRRRPLEFEIGDHVWLKVSHVKGISRFEVSRKLSPQYIEPFEILQRIGSVAYELALPPSLD